jgi:hypothetical protein
VRSLMAHNFATVPQVNNPRSSFKAVHGYKTAFDAGWLIPVFFEDALPGDTFNLRMAGFGRVATLLYPLMDNMYVSTFFFSIPFRLLWENFTKFCGEQVDPSDSTDYTIPQQTPPTAGYAELSLSDYFGWALGIGSGNTPAPNALYYRAYNLVWNEHFRDENLQDSVVVDIDDGPDTDTDYVLLKRGKRHDYFTSCLPWPQKGDALELPLGTSAPVIGNDGTIRFIGTSSGAYGTLAADGGASNQPAEFNVTSGTMSSNEDVKLTAQAAYSGMKADLSAAVAPVVNDLREVLGVQNLYEIDARGGTRYPEIIRNHFGVVSPDARMHRPEILGVRTTAIRVNPIAQTESSDASTPQGSLAATGTIMFENHGFVKSFTEHCAVLGLICVHADLTYQQGIDSAWFRQTRADYYWPALAHIGEQPVYNKEIYCDGSANDDLVFGYQEKDARYRFKPSRVTGPLRSSYSSSLDSWHLSQDFGSLPTLGDTFIQEDPPLDRAVATPSEPHVILDTYFDFIMARAMPTYSIPGLGVRL